jgi:hypothetical protein
MRAEIRKKLVQRFGNSFVNKCDKEFHEMAEGKRKMLAGIVRNVKISYKEIARLDFAKLPEEERKEFGALLDKLREQQNFADRLLAATKDLDDWAFVSWLRKNEGRF